MRKLRIAQIGVRHEHADGKMNAVRLQMQDTFEVVGIAAESPKWQEKEKDNRAYKGLQWMSQEELLAIPDLDAVLVETEMTELIDTAEKCFAKRLPIHIDKPGGSEELDRYAQLVNKYYEANLPFQVAYMFRGHPYMKFARKIAKSGVLGDVFELDANMHRNDTGRDDFRNWLAGYAGGAMFDYGSHLIDIAFEIFGAPEKVHCIRQRIIGDALYDNGVALLEYKKATATLRSCMSTPGGGRKLSLRGTNGTLEIQPIEQTTDEEHRYPLFDDKPLVVKMEILKDTPEYKAGKHEIPFHTTGRYIDQLEEFAAMLRGEVKNPYSAEYEITLQKLILAASGYIEW